MEFNQELKDLRTQKGLTQKQVFTKLEIPKSTYSHWECGSKYPPKWVQKLVLNEIKRMK